MTIQQDISRSEDRISARRRQRKALAENASRTTEPPSAPHPIDVVVGRRIRSLRIRLGFTQQQLAEKVGVKFQQLQKYETAMNRVSASRLMLIAEALGVSVLDIFDTPDQPAQPSEAVSHEAEALVRAFLTLPKHQRGVVRRLIDDLREGENAQERT